MIQTLSCLDPANEEFQRLKSLMIDFFRGPEVTNVRLAGIEHVLQFTAVEKKVLFRSYRILLKKSGTRVPRVELEEIGPRIDWTVRRNQFASEDLFKTACKQVREHYFTFTLHTIIYCRSKMFAVRRKSKICRKMNLVTSWVGCMCHHRTYRRFRLEKSKLSKSPRKKNWNRSRRKKKRLSQYDRVKLKRFLAQSLKILLLITNIVSNKFQMKCPEDLGKMDI